MRIKSPHFAFISLLLANLWSAMTFGSPSNFCSEAFNKGAVQSEVSSEANGLRTTHIEVSLNIREFNQLVQPGTDGRQRAPDWCWAASAQMTLAFHGISVKQELFIQKYGNGPGGSADQPAIIKALNDTSLVGSNWRGELIMRDENLIEELKSNRPVLIEITSGYSNSSSHMYVLVGAVAEKKEFIDDGISSMFITKYEVYDPASSSSQPVWLEGRFIENRIRSIIAIKPR